MVARDVPGVLAPNAPSRPPEAWLRESVGWLALEATRETYAAQPRLWELGDHGRARTLEDFTHHLHAVVPGDERRWRDHLRYCLHLFDRRGFPHFWLAEAFVTLDRVFAAALPEEVTSAARALLHDAPAMMAELAHELGIDLERSTDYDRLR